MDICLQCWLRPKRKNYTFCSSDCSKAAAKKAPALLWIPPDHVMFKNVEATFRSTWQKSIPAPSIKAIYLITWTDQMRSSFDGYRANVESQGHFVTQGLTPGNEVKRFRAEKRACFLGDAGCINFCQSPYCHLCCAIRSGFFSSLAYKRTVFGAGIRLGHGVYTTPASSKAAHYAKDLHNQSSCRAILCTRVTLGRQFHTIHEDTSLVRPPSGFDSVKALVAPGSVFSDEECVVYDERAIKPAYLIMISPV